MSFAVDIQKRRPPDLIGAWNFDTGSLADYSIGGRTLTPSGAVVTNRELVFDGVNDYASTATRVPVGAAYTISFWAKFTNFTGAGPNGVQFLLSQRSAASVTSNEAEWQFSRNNPVTNNTIGFTVFNTAGTAFAASTGSVPSMSTGVYYHFVGTFDGSNVRGYHNGALVETTAFSGARQTAATTMWAGSNTWANALPFNGCMDNIAIFSRTLSTAEVLKLYTLGQQL